MIPRKGLLLASARVIELLLAPFTLAGAIWLKFARHFGLQHLRITQALLRKVGVLPVRDHYYEPLINPRHLRFALEQERDLPGLDLNVAEQLDVLDRFTYQEELKAFPLHARNELEYYYCNGSFESGDSEYLYSIVRSFRPRKIIEIGSGYSTLMVRNAVKRNAMEQQDYACDHVCIEPYEQPWLERLGIRIVRQPVETIEVSTFESLAAGDILFIDSSHIIRPQGDVLFEYLSVLPRLASGVLVHIHDIFTPRDYLREWVVTEGRLWNEQYLLEAFLSMNHSYRVIGALNYLTHRHPAAVSAKLPILGAEIAHREPGSFWMVRA